MTEKLIMNLRDISHVMRFLYEGKASQKRILIILDGSETVTQRELTERLGIKPGSASEILSKLENAGLIIRTQNKEDHRTMDICLTDAGRKLAAEALAQRKNGMRKCFPAFQKKRSRSYCHCWKLFVQIGEPVIVTMKVSTGIVMDTMAGKVLVDGIDVKEYKKEVLREKIVWKDHGAASPLS